VGSAAYSNTLAPMRTVALIQARTGSTRLPGKVLAELGGQPLLSLVIERTLAAPGLDAVAVATSDLRRDDAVAALAERSGVGVVRGSEQDVLDRFRAGARQLGAELVVRVTADCPLVDPELIGRLLAFREREGLDYAAIPTGGIPGVRCFPDGLDTEVFTADALDIAWREATSAPDREHVSLLIKRDARFRRAFLESDVDLARERWTVDHPEDLEFVRAVVARLGRDCGYRDVLALLEREPTLREINVQPSRT
jgi:spore coat polysaccharide biosynthesis protein SpsF (cytidylyltransferase family)